MTSRCVNLALSLARTGRGRDFICLAPNLILGSYLKRNMTSLTETGNKATLTKHTPPSRILTFRRKASPLLHSARSEILDGIITLSYPDGCVLQGPVASDGTLSGKGLLVTSSGEVFVGHYKNGVIIDGQGMERTHLTTYCGNFVSGRKEGIGRMVWKEGDVFTGEWRNNWFLKGTFVNVSGSEYTGEFYFNRKHGRGVMRNKDGTVYDGEWVNDLHQGRGTLTYPTMPPFSGLFHQGRVLSGRGFYADKAAGLSFQGEWARGAPEGRGLLFPAHGTRGAVFEAEFRDGQLVAKTPVMVSNRKAAAQALAERKKRAEAGSGSGTETGAITAAGVRRGDKRENSARYAAEAESTSAAAAGRLELGLELGAVERGRRAGKSSSNINRSSNINVNVNSSSERNGGSGDGPQQGQRQQRIRPALSHAQFFEQLRRCVPSGADEIIKDK